MDQQLARAARDVKYFRGVFSVDQLPLKPWENESVIVNLQKSSKSGVGHWVCFGKRGKKVRYFDSLPKVAPPPEVVAYLKGTNLTFNTLRRQSYGESNCGQLCVLFLLGHLENSNHRLV